MLSLHPSALGLESLHFRALNKTCQIVKGEYLHDWCGIGWSGCFQQKTYSISETEQGKSCNVRTPQDVTLTLNLSTMFGVL